MKHPRLDLMSAPLALAVLAGPALSAQAAPVLSSKQILMQLYMQLSLALGGPAPTDGRQASPSGNGTDPGIPFLCLKNGEFLPAGLSEDKLADVKYLSNLLDPIPTPKPIWADSGLKYSGVVHHIVFDAVRKSSLSSTEKTKLETLRQQLLDTDQGNPALLKDGDGKVTVSYHNYLVCQKAYQAAAAVRDAAPSGQTNTDLTNKLNDWQNAGAKGQIEGWKQQQQALLSKSGDERWNGYQDRYRGGQLDEAGTMRIGLFPPPSSWDQGWTHFKFVTSSITFNAEVSSEAASFGASYEGIGADASNAEAQRMQSSAENDFWLEVDLKGVQITRDWLDMQIFQYHDWHMPSGDKKISYGPARQPAQMPVLTTEMFLARNLRLHGKSLSSFLKSSASSSSTGVSTPAFGPFQLKESTSSSNSDLTLDDQGNVVAIDSKGVQVIGFNCAIVPVAPAPAS